MSPVKKKLPSKEAEVAFIEGTVPARVIASLFDVSLPRVSQLFNEGVITKHERGRFVIATVVPQYVRWLRSKRANSNAASTTYDDQRTRLTKASADIKEREALLQAGELLEVGQVTSAWGRVLGLMRQRIVTMCDLLAPQVQDCGSIEEYREVIRTFAEALLTELANTEVTYDAAEEVEADVLEVQEEQEEKAKPVVESKRRGRPPGSKNKKKAA